MQINLHIIDPAYLDSTTELPTDPNAAARGRNGWFCPTQIDVWQCQQIWLSVRSRRQGANAPIQLQISPVAAHALAHALLAATADLAQCHDEPTWRESDVVDLSAPVVTNKVPDST